MRMRASVKAVATSPSVSTWRRKGGSARQAALTLQSMCQLANLALYFGTTSRVLTLSSVPVGKKGSTSVKDPMKSLGSA